MRKHHLAPLLALLLACGSAQAQFKDTTKSKPRDPLGSGLGGKPAKPAAKPDAKAEDNAPTMDTVVQDIANCVLAGLPKEWVLAQVEVTEIGRDGKQREFEAKYSYSGADGKGAVFTPCDLKEPAQNIYQLNAALEPDKRDWIKATLVLSNEGKFELQYDYPKKDGDAAPAPAPAAPAPAVPKANAPKK